MAIIVETGSGVDNANSYLSEADADAYFSLRVNTTWTDAITAVKEKALVLGTQYLDNLYRGRWEGRRVDRTQALEWPRLDVVDANGFLIPSSEIPQVLKDATAEAAVRDITTSLMPDVTNPGRIKKTEIRVGDITDLTEYSSGGAGQVEEFPIITSLMTELVVSAQIVERG